MLTIRNELKCRERDDLVEAEDDEQISDKDIYIQEKEIEMDDLTNNDRAQMS